MYTIQRVVGYLFKWQSYLVTQDKWLQFTPTVPGKKGVNYCLKSSFFIVNVIKIVNKPEG